jgi:hypothetical protein
MSRDRVDARTAATEPFQPSPQHELLAAMQGEWSGPTKTWLDPSQPPDECTTDVTASLVLGGRWLRLAYRGVVMGKRHAGEMLLGYHRDGKTFQVVQIDSFHTGSEILKYEGPVRENGEISVLGSYTAGTETWGWRTSFQLESPDVFVIRAWNIMPDGQEFPAIETRLARQ